MIIPGASDPRPSLRFFKRLAKAFSRVLHADASHHHRDACVLNKFSTRCLLRENQRDVKYNLSLSEYIIVCTMLFELRLLKNLSPTLISRESIFMFDRITLKRLSKY